MHESEQYLARKVVLDQANKDLAQAQTNLAAARKDEAALAQHRADEITKTQQTETEDLQGQVANAMGYADGGYVSGPSGIDTVPAWLSPGEYVVNPSPPSATSAGSRRSTTASRCR